MTSARKIPFTVQFTSVPAPHPDATSFTLSPATSTPSDIWRKPGPPFIQTFNAPIIYKTIKLASFQRAQVTVTGKWERLYDQGGLVFILPGATGQAKWIKTGVEFYEGDSYVSTVVCDRWADWSLVQAGIRDGQNGDNSVVLEIERNAKEGTLWIYVVLENGKRVPLRECTWVLSEEDQDVWVGVYAATPTIEGRGEEDALVVKFQGWELEVMG